METDPVRPYSHALECLRNAGLRPTRQRLALAKLLLTGEGHHITAEQLHEKAIQNQVRVSLATVYNTLNQFIEAGLLREIVVEAGRSYFDTNTTAHHHYFHEETGQLEDIPNDSIELTKLPMAPEGTEIARVDVVVRLRHQH